MSLADKNAAPCVGRESEASVYERRLAKTSELPASTPFSSKLSFEGVNDKKNAHTGYFRYRVGDDGLIYCRWDPIIASKPFRVSCSNRRELPMRAFDASPAKLQKLLSKIVGPYTFVYDEKTSTVLVTPRSDLDQVGFILKKGKLVEVPLEQASQWHLHDKRGGPKLPRGVKIEEIQVANEAIFARGSDNLMYFYSPGVKRKGERVKWEAYYGFFDKGSILFPKDMRDWAAGVSVQMKPWQRRGLDFTNPWTDVDSYCGDEDYKIAQGVTITLGVIPSHGRTIQIWDSGLPGDLHRGFLTPDRGRVQAEKVAQAGSFWVVYGFDRDGLPCLYERVENYEGHGACIGMQHSCEPPQTLQGQGAHHVMDMGEAIRTIPLRGWSKIAFPDLVGRAGITDRLSVHCTGEGESSREIRIEGTDSDGHIGFYYKNLEEPSWHFRITSQVLLKGKPIHIGVRDPSKVTHAPITRDYEGDSSWTGLKDAPISKMCLLEFHPYQTQSEESTLRFTLNSGKNIDVHFRTADAWSPFKRERFEDATVWEGVGVPKILVGTLDIPQSVLSSDDDEVRAFANTYLKPYHHVPNLFEVVADLDRICVATSGHTRQNGLSSAVSTLPPCSFSFSRDAFGETMFERLGASSKAKAIHGMSHAQLREVIQHNNDLKILITAFQSARHAQARRFARRWKNMNILLFSARVLTFAMGIRDRPFIGAVLDLTPRLISAHRTAFVQASRSKIVPKGITDALALIEDNLFSAKRLLK